jgi:ABC-type glutathione transport system ATPase component
MTEPLLRIRNLRVGYVLGDEMVDAVRSASLSVSAGEVVGIVGESGSGKSSLVRGALRLLPPPAVVLGGSVEFEGTDLLSAAPASLRALRGARIGLVPQSAMAALNPVLTVREHFLETLVAHGIRTGHSDRVSRALQDVELSPSSADRFPHQLSGGMRQRVAIALALLLEPTLVVFDEPTTALDVVLERDILDRVLALREEREFAGIFVSHDLGLVARICDRVAVMHDGQVVEVASPSNLMDAPEHPQTLALRDAARSLGAL